MTEPAADIEVDHRQARFDAAWRSHVAWHRYWEPHGYGVSPPSLAEKLT